MKYEQVLATVLALHHEEARHDQMVYQVFEDGEITLQKGGDLLWQRTLHCVASGHPTKAIRVSDMPHQMRSTPHGYIFCKNHEAALAARAAIFDLDI